MELNPGWLGRKYDGLQRGQGSRSREVQRGKQRIVEAKNKLVNTQIMILLHISCLPRGELEEVSLWDAGRRGGQEALSGWPAGVTWS